MSGAATKRKATSESPTPSELKLRAQHAAVIRRNLMNGPVDRSGRPYPARPWHCSKYPVGTTRIAARLADCSGGNANAGSSAQWRWPQIARKSNHSRAALFIDVAHLYSMAIQPRALLRTLAREFRSIFFRTRVDFRLLTEASADVICLLTPALHILFISRAALQVFGREPADIMGRRLHQFVAVNDLPEIVASI